MTKVIASITTSLDGYITGLHDGPGRGLGEGGERQGCVHHGRGGCDPPGVTRGIRGRAVGLDCAGRVGWREAPVRRLRRDTEPGAVARAPIAVGDAYQLPCRQVTGVVSLT